MLSLLLTTDVTVPVQGQCIAEFTVQVHLIFHTRDIEVTRSIPSLL